MARPMAAQNAGSGSRMLMVFVLSAVVVFLVSVVIIMGVVRCQNPILLDLVDICFFFDLSCFLYCTFWRRYGVARTVIC